MQARDTRVADLRTPLEELDTLPFQPRMLIDMFFGLSTTEVHVSTATAESYRTFLKRLTWGRVLC